MDGDDSHVYGQSQYSECDVILPTTTDTTNKKEENANLYLRKLVVGQDPNGSGSSNNVGAIDTPNTKKSIDEIRKCEKMDIDLHQTENESNHTLSSDNKMQIIHSLKAKIRELESHISNKCKCLICMDEFRIPVVSICCWHVHCEECWLRTLGARKLCPQCNMITSPSDLRRIYM